MKRFATNVVRYNDGPEDGTAETPATTDAPATDAPAAEQPAAAE